MTTCESDEFHSFRRTLNIKFYSTISDNCIVPAAVWASEIEI